jgi:hypothetical protein
MRDIVDVERYPLLELDGNAARRLIERGRIELARTGAFVLPEFVRPRAVDVMLGEIEAARPLALRRNMMRPAEEREDVPETYTLRYHTFGYDLFGAESTIRRLYEWDNLTNFIGSVFGLPAYYRCADPVISCLVHDSGEGDQISWHFDQNDGVMTVLLQRCEQGGVLELAPWIKRDDPGAVGAVVEGTYENITRVDPVPGTLTMFQGLYSMHRATPVKGKTSRINIVASYSSTPGYMFSEAQRRAYTAQRNETE